MHLSSAPKQQNAMKGRSALHPDVRKQSATTIAFNFGGVY
jgi:hypothetical protein